MKQSDYIKVRYEESILGAILGAGVGLVCAMPLVAPLTTLNPLAPGLGISARVGVLVAWTLMAVGGVACAWLLSRQERDSHMRGVRYFPDFRDATRALQAQEKAQFSKAQSAGDVHGIRIGGVELARTREVGQVYVVGLPGSGKTVLLTSLAEQVLDRGGRLVVHDPKGDFVARFFDAATTVLLGPWDDRAATWDASADINTPALANEFAHAVVSGGLPVSAQTGNAKHFIDGASRLLAGIIRSYQAAGRGWRWADLKDVVVSDDPVTMIQRAAAGDAALKLTFPSVFPQDPKQAPALSKDGPSIVSTLGNAGGWLVDFGAVDEARPDAARFSLRDWLLGKAHTNTRIVVLNSNALYPQACANLFGAMLSTIAATLASPDMPEVSADAPHGTWLLLDEFPQLGSTALEKMQQIAALGRSRGVRTVTALQDESQLVAKVGRDAAEPMLSVQGTQVYMRCSNKTAEAVSSRVGSCDVHRIETTSETGAVQGKTRRVVTKSVLVPGDLVGLKKREKAPPLGMELILHIGDVAGHLVQPFGVKRTAIAPAIVESEPWKIGALPRLHKSDAVPEPAVAGTDGAFSLEDL